MLGTDSFDLQDVRTKDLRRASFTLLALLAVAILPEAAYASLSGGSASGANLGIQDALTTITDYITGPVATAAATVAMVAILGGIIVRSQRGESITSLASVGVALVVIVNIEEVMTLLGLSQGATMASPEKATAASEVSTLIAGIL